ncbi:LOW QUALITY PROTEIN: uncharacterized protein C1orf87 homolog [Rhynchonycteris naso]
MSSAWKTPHGSHAIPKTVVKIIGSKHFQYLVEKPEIKENENSKAETQRVLQKSVTVNARQMSRDPPAPSNPNDHQISHDPDDVEDSKHPESNQKLLTEALSSSSFLDDKANVHCISVPTGDQSLSYIHGLPRRKLKDWTLEQMGRGTDPPEDIGQRSSGFTKEDIFLLTLVRRELKSHPFSTGLLDKLQKELKILDSITSGFLLQSQLSRLFLRHGVPLQLLTVKILCQRFSRDGSPEMVNYEKLLCFLKVAASDDSQPSKRLVDSNLQKAQSGSHPSERLSPAPPSSSAPQHSNLQSDMNKSLLEIFKMALRTANGKLNIESLHLSFRKEDRAFSGYLTPLKVRDVCGKHGLYLTLSLLETLLSHQDLTYQNEIKWQSFIELLSRASSDLSYDLPIGKKRKESSATSVQAEAPVMSGQNEHMKSPEEEQQPKNLPAESSPPRDPLSSLTIKPVSQPFASPAMKNKPEECETWIDRFRKLENALYLCDLSNTGVLGKERARRLIHNYNLIYNLSLSPQKMDQALKRFCSGENMLLEPARQYLKEL